MPRHVGCMHALCRHGVMRTAGGMDVMIAAPPTKLRGIDPTLHLELQRRVLAGDRHLALLRQGFRPTTKGDVVNAIRQLQRFTIAAIDLRVEEKIGRVAFDLRGIDTSCGVFDEQFGDARFAIFIGDGEFHLTRRLAVEQDAHFVAEAEILRALAGVEAKGGITFACIAAVELDDAIFDAEAAQIGLHRRCFEHLQVEPASGKHGLAGITRLRVRCHGR